MTTQKKDISLSELKNNNPAQLFKITEDEGLQVPNRAAKQDLLFAIIAHYAKQEFTIIGDGTVEQMQDGYGFLRSSSSSYLPGKTDIYVSPNQMRRLQLKTGDAVSGKIRSPKQGERYFAMVQIETVNDLTPEELKRKVEFENLTPLHPDERMRLERGNGTTEDITARIIDLIAPIGKGQRALIVSPPKAGKTVMLQNIAHAITNNHPKSKLIVLLIDERPEEVTEMQRSVQGEVVASTFDEPAARHVQVADMVIAKAKRMVESKQDVVILLDSITRLARAYNTVTPSSGKVLTGGVDSQALQRPKRFFGAARNIEHGGSLTIIATALVETGSKMDEIIYEEFKGTGNNEIHLTRGIAERRIFPAININASGTRREELLTTEEELRRMWLLRKYLNTMDGSTEFLIKRLKSTKTNSAFFDAMLKTEKS
jgi:transcription termination factor Rho